MAACRRLDEVTSPDAARQLRRLRLQIEEQVEQVVDVLLFGSRARGQAKIGSDYDVAVLVNGTGVQRSALRTVSSLALPYIRSGYHFRPVVIDETCFDHPVEHALARNIAADGISIR